MIKERPILFSGEMVKAIIEGRKTMTRRVVKWKDTELAPVDHMEYDPYYANISPFYRNEDKTLIWGKCPFGKVGDRLWVRESFKYTDPISRIDYEADGEHILHHSDEACKKFADVFERNPDNIGRWYPSIHMPRWASRIFLEITDIRIERLQDISEEDARKEGVLFKDNGDSLEYYNYTDGRWETLSDIYLHRGLPAKQAFVSLWESINLGTWPYNPWVWVVSFRQIEKGDDHEK